LQANLIHLLAVIARSDAVAERGRFAMVPISPITSPGRSQATVVTLDPVTDVTNAWANPRRSTSTLSLGSPSRQIGCPAT
jgi:hypothetical protein